MPYCHKCGAKLDEDARFCPVCGTPVSSVSLAEKSATPQGTYQRPRKTIFPLVGIVLIAILVISVVGVVIAFAPFQPISFSQSNEATAGNVDTLNLVVEADVANVNVIMKDLPGNQRAAVNVTATGWRGIFGTDKPLALGFNEDTSNSTLTYAVNVSRSERWMIFNTLNVNCDVIVDPSVKLDITVHTATGSITMNANTDTTIQSLDLQATTGSVEAMVNGSVILPGDFSIKATTGTVRLQWNELKVMQSIPVNVMTTTGSAEVNITQSRQFVGNVTLNAQTTTGGVNFAMHIQNDVGARISATTTIGGVNVQQSGFDGNQSPLQSDNYPSGNNFIVLLNATTGGIDINAVYDLGGTRS
jgi:uncharacterized membrane protein YvbJ